MKTALILGAGLGTRMRPWTFFTPKPLLTIVNKPIIFWHIDKLIEAGIKNIIINTHHLGYKLHSYIKFYVYQKLFRNDIKISILEENTILGTGGALYNAKALIDSNSFLMINSDIIHNYNIKEIFDYHKNFPSIATLVIRKTLDEKLKQVSIDEKKNIQSIGPLNILNTSKNTKEFCFTGIHVINLEIFKYIEKNKYQCIIRDIYKKACILNSEILKGLEMTGYWNDIGNAEDYLIVHKDILNKNFIL